MTTSDPPHELRGPLGQVTDQGRAVSPAPHAASGSPGLATSAAKPIAMPTVPSDDPGSIILAVMQAQTAGDLFGAGSIVPMVQPTHVTALSAPSPGSPGIAPALVPMAPPIAGGPMTPTVVPMGSNAATSIAPVSGSQPSSASAPSTPGSASAAPSRSGAPSTQTAPSSSGASPFSMSSHDSLASFDLGDLAGLTGLPALDLALVNPIEAPPSYTPDAGALGLAPALDFSGLANEHRDLDVRQTGGTAFDPHVVRRDFPILEERIHGKRLVWLDNAATTQKPRAVIDRLTQFYEHENSNIHRAAHTLAARATDAYESARRTVQRFLNAPSDDEIIFVRGATEGINLIAQSWGRKNLQPGDEIVLTHLEHHANIVPWQQVCALTGAKLRVAPVDDRGDVILEEYDRLLSSKTKLVAFTQVSNALGTITPAREMVAMAHRHGACVMVDGAQAVSHMRADVQDLDCDFYVFSGHKVFAPTGIGVVFGKAEVLEAMPPWQGGGNMIQDVTFERTTYQPPPFRFEAGTGNIADAAGLGAALDYVMKIGIETIDSYEHDLLGYATTELARVPGLTMIGTSATKAGVLSFVLDGQRTEDVGAALDKEGIAVRSGHHCAQPILRRFGLESTVRASLAFYNVCEDIDALVEALLRIQAGR